MDGEDGSTLAGSLELGVGCKCVIKRQGMLRREIVGWNQALSVALAMTEDAVYNDILRATKAMGGSKSTRASIMELGELFAGEVRRLGVTGTQRSRSSMIVVRRDGL